MTMLEQEIKALQNKPDTGNPGPESLINDHSPQQPSWSTIAAGGVPAYPRLQRQGPALAAVTAPITIALKSLPQYYQRAEAEASIRSVTARHSLKSTSFWVNVNTLPPSHPLTRVGTRKHRRFASPFQKIAHQNEALQVKGLEIIKPYTIPPWEDRVNPREDSGPDSWPALLGSPGNMVIMTTSAERQGLVGAGGATYDSSKTTPGSIITLHEAVLGPRALHNPYQAELVAIDLALKGLPKELRGRNIIVGSSNLGAVRAITRPKQQSGQQYIETIYRMVQTLRLNGNTVLTAWAPAHAPNELKSQAKHAARRALQHVEIW